MSLLLIIFALAAVPLYLGLPALEIALGVLLVTPVLAFASGLAVPLSPQVYYGCAAAALAVVLLAASRTKLTPGNSQRMRDEGLPLLLFALFFAVCFNYSSQVWPDFVAMGERLRDYSILASAVRNPQKIAEPWLAGYPLFYYAYWYRFGAMLAYMLGEPVWQVYHIMVSFSLAFYFAVIFRILNRFARFSMPAALLAALIVSLGSNVAGFLSVIYSDAGWFTHDKNWWGPSRVIQGAINEFPAWSFLLGDLHPHYAGLGLIPFFLLLFMHAGASEGHVWLRLPPQRAVLIVALLVLPPLWIFNANAWELPMWLGLLGAFLFFLLLSSRGRVLGVMWRTRPSLRSLIDYRYLAGMVALLICVASLLLSAPEMRSGSGALTLVRYPIQLTRTSEVFLHWGLPLSMVAAATLLLINNRVHQVIGLIALLGALLYRDAVVFLYTLLLIAALRILEVMQFGLKRPRTPGQLTIIFEALGFSALGLLLLPEVVFLDDPYGGENERMNTIFKVYTTNWFLLHGYALYLGSRVLEKFVPDARKTVSRYVCWACGTALFLGFSFPFFAATTGLRKSGEVIVAPAAEGLSELERRFPGSAEIIRRLRDLPDGIVLEAQGNAYDYTSFVGTLAEKTHFLGWSNHVNLLTQEYAEITRREQVTRQIYEDSECARKARLLEQEHIDYVVVGTLEHQKHPQLNLDSFACLKLIAKDKDYHLYSRG